MEGEKSGCANIAPTVTGLAAQNVPCVVETSHPDWLNQKISIVLSTTATTREVKLILIIKTYGPKTLGSKSKLWLDL